MRIRALCYLLALALHLPALAQQLPLPATVSTLAGTSGRRGSADGRGEVARFQFPHSLAVAANGMLYVVDMDDHTLRQITPAGEVSTLAGAAGQKGSLDGTGAAARFNGPAGVALDAAGTLYVADAGSHVIRKVSPAGVVTTLAGSPNQKGSADGPGAAARFNAPHAVAVDAAGTVYVADTYNHTIRRITPAGVVTTLAGAAGRRGTADGPGAAARFAHPAGLAADAQGTLYVADNGNHTIRRITPAGEVSTLAGQAGHRGSADGLGAAAQFNVPASLALAPDGVLFVADYFNSTIRLITPNGQVTTFAGAPRFWSSYDGPRLEARFKCPFGIAVGANNWLYVADSGNYTIRLIR